MFRYRFIKEINVDWSKLTRNYFEFPLKRIKSSMKEPICYEDLAYLAENFCYSDICRILASSDKYVIKYLKKYNLKVKINGRKGLETKEEKEIKRYGQLGLSRKEKLKITIDKYGREEFNKKRSEAFHKAWNKRTKEDEQDRQRKAKETKLIRYNDPNFTNNEKRKATNLERYGVETKIITKEVLEKTHSKESRAKAIQTAKITNSKKTEEDFKRSAQKARETYLKKTGYDCWMNNPNVDKTECKRKRYETLRRNKTFNVSKPEQDILSMLQAKFKEVKTEYTSEEYPFRCDFYIPEINLYIEYQGHWSHGFRPFNGTEEDLKKVEVWKSRATNTNSYNISIRIWTVRDPLKRETARKNGLNWIEFFNIKEFRK